MNDMTPGEWKGEGDANEIVPLPEAPPADGWRKDFRKGGLIALAFFGGLLGFAAFVPLDAGAYADGIVAVSGNRQAVQHPSGGVVTHLDVTEGQMVSKGQELLTVSASELLANERSMTMRVIALLAERNRLIAEQTGAPGVARPFEFSAFTGDDANMAAQALRAQQNLFAARRASLSAQRGVLGQRIRQQSEVAAGTSAQVTSNREQSRLIKEELDAMKTLQERGFVSLNRIREMERAQAQLDGNFGAYQADIARAGEAAGEARLQIAGVERQLMEEVSTRLRDVQVELGDLQPKLAAVREQLSRAIVRAPASGKVVGLKVFTVGGVIAPGETLMEIVPQDKRLVINAKASPNDGDDIQVGMKTQVRFSALQERDLPILHGAVTKISADSFEDERTGQHYYTLEVVVPPSELAKVTAIRGDTGMRAGLPAQILIPLRKRSALTYLMEPLTQTLWRSGHEH